MLPIPYFKFRIHNTLRLLLALVVLVFMACKDDSNNQPQSTSCQSPFQLDSLPLNTGNNWRYLYQHSLTDSNGVLTDTSTVIINRTVISDTILNGNLCYKLLQIDSNLTSGIAISSTIYCFNATDGFYMAAAEGNSYFLSFRQKGNVSSDRNDDYLSGQKCDSIFICYPPVKLLQFPSQMNDQWVVYDTAPGTNCIREYENCQSITTTAGNYDCLKVSQLNFDNGVSDSIPLYFYFSSKGLILNEETVHLLTGDILYSQSKLISINF